MSLKFLLLVFMKDVRAEDMEALLDFVYLGVASIPQVNLASLLKTAEGLQVSNINFFRYIRSYHFKYLLD